MSHRISRRWTLIALAFVGGTVARAEPEEPKKEGVTCRHWAVLLPEDAGQHRVYDGIRKGLELAQMERVCLKEVEDTDASFKELVAWHATLPKPEPLLFAIGRRAGARLVAAGYAGPGVLVSTEVTAKGEPLEPEPALGPRMARVRAEVAAEQLGVTVRELLGLPATARPSAWAHRAPDRFYEAAGFSIDAEHPIVWEDELPSLPKIRALLQVRFGPASSRLRFENARFLAMERRIPLVCDDPAQFGHGATLVIVPDHQRVGRTAAEAGRRLWQGEPDALGKPLIVRTTEVWVDLVAAQEIGLEPPLTFLAAADRVRAPPKKAAPAPGAPRTPPAVPAPSAPK